MCPSPGASIYIAWHLRSIIIFTYVYMDVPSRHKEKKTMTWWQRRDMMCCRPQRLSATRLIVDPTVRKHCWKANNRACRPSFNNVITVISTWKNITIREMLKYYLNTQIIPIPVTGKSADQQRHVSCQAFSLQIWRVPVGSRIISEESYPTSLTTPFVREPIMKFHIS